MTHIMCCYHAMHTPNYSIIVHNQAHTRYTIWKNRMRDEGIKNKLCTTATTTYAIEKEEQNVK